MIYTSLARWVKLSRLERVQCVSTMYASGVPFPLGQYQNSRLTTATILEWYTYMYLHCILKPSVVYTYTCIGSSAFEINNEYDISDFIIVKKKNWKVKSKTMIWSVQKIYSVYVEMRNALQKSYTKTRYCIYTKQYIALVWELLRLGAAYQALLYTNHSVLLCHYNSY